MQVKDVIMAPLPHIDSIKEVGEEDSQIFNDLFAVLKKHNAVNRFGINLLHSHFEVGPDEVLLEVTDSLKRKQLVEPISVSELSKMSVIETSWRFDALGKPQAESRCQKENTSIPPQHVDRRL